MSPALAWDLHTCQGLVCRDQQRTWVTWGHTFVGRNQKETLPLPVTPKPQEGREGQGPFHGSISPQPCMVPTQKTQWVQVVSHYALGHQDSSCTPGQGWKQALWPYSTLPWGPPTVPSSLASPYLPGLTTHPVPSPHILPLGSQVCLQLWQEGAVHSKAGPTFC